MRRPSTFSLPPSTFVHEWEWDASHHPLPLTRSFGSVYPGWIEAAMRVMFAEFGLLPESVEMRLRGGYPFTRVKPIALPFTPPRRLLQAALRLWWLHPAAAGRVRTSVRRIRADHSAAVLGKWERRWREAIQGEHRAFRAVPLDSLADQQLADHIERLTRRTSQWVTVHFLLHGAIAIPLLRLQRFLDDQPGTSGVRMADLVEGSSFASSAPAKALAQVAATLRDESAVLERAERAPAAEGLSILREASPAFREAFDAFLERYGLGIVGRYEFAVPTLGERPELLVPAILSGAREVDDERQSADTARRLRLETMTTLLDNSDGERELRTLVAAARRAYAVRDENVQITFVDAFGLCRLALLAAGRRLKTRGSIDAPEDVFFLTVAEAVAALRSGGGSLHYSVEERRRTWLDAVRRPPERGHGRRLPLPRFDGLPDGARELHEAIVGYLREIMAAPDIYADAAANAAEVRGVGAVRGRYVGTARVLRSEQEFDRLRPGEVLVCPMTSPAWAVALPLAGALVTDHGGILSHPAVIAREFGIPAVVATRRATSVIPDGATVEVDGDAGIVRILAE